jgi:hypothetical protein
MSRFRRRLADVLRRQVLQQIQSQFHHSYAATVVISVQLYLKSAAVQCGPCSSAKHPNHQQLLGARLSRSHPSASRRRNSRFRHFHPLIELLSMSLMIQGKQSLNWRLHCLRGSRKQPKGASCQPRIIALSFRSLSRRRERAGVRENKWRAFPSLSSKPATMP